jgi:hypothetical protein
VHRLNPYEPPKEITDNQSSLEHDKIGDTVIEVLVLLIIVAAAIVMLSQIMFFLVNTLFQLVVSKTL